MSDTIKLLETIGQNAALRHASPEALAHALEHAQASEPLKAAIASGDSSLLFEELGHKPMEVPHTQASHEEDVPDQDEDGDEDTQHPPTHEGGQPSRQG